MMTFSDYDILRSILSKEDKNKGLNPTNATTKKEIIEKTKLSMTKVNTTLYGFIKDGLVSQGLRIKNSNTYYLTDKGLEEYIKLKGVNLNVERN